MTLLSRSMLSRMPSRTRSLRNLNTYAPPSSKYVDVRDLRFMLHDVPHLVTPFPSDDTLPILEAAEAFANVHGHLDAKFDEHECKFDPSHFKSSLEYSDPLPSCSPVINHPSTKPLLDAYVEAGFTQMQDPEGLNLPYPLAAAASAVTSSAFTSGVLGHWTLTQCAANLLKEHGNPELVQKYHPKLVDGTWTGTMALSETQAGSSLLEISTTAKPVPGSFTQEYKIKGSKMWTSAADHALYDNIIHMLLAKTESGISLFLVPKNLVNDDGSLGARNDYVINGLNHKMGCRGLSNCYWSLGDDSDGATGFLIGEEGKGLNCMFFMMNEMRIHVGIGASVCGMRGYFESLTYACDRKQGRRKPNPSSVPIIEHSDVKRMLLQQKSYSEGAMMLCLFAASLNSSTDPSDRLLLDFVIPLVKSWPSEWCLEANKWAIQVLGGYGYTRDFPLEQVYRDNRLNMIHEGTAGIQSLDLLGRKTMTSRGEALKIFLSRVEEACFRVNDDAELAPYSQALAKVTMELAETALHLTKKMGDGDVEAALSNSHEYLNAVGHVAIGWMWLEQAHAARKLSDSDSYFVKGKVSAMKYFFDHELVKVPVQFRILKTSTVVQDLDVSELLS